MIPATLGRDRHAAHWFLLFLSYFASAAYAANIKSSYRPPYANAAFYPTRWGWLAPVFGFIWYRARAFHALLHGQSE